jgi:hypothetical protein
MSLTRYSNDDYYHKYMKYKQKYLMLQDQLQSQSGGRYGDYYAIFV